MSDEKKRRRRRGRRGGQGRSQGENAPDAQQRPTPSPQAKDAAPAEGAPGRGPRRDTRRGRGGMGEAPAEPPAKGPPSPSNPSIRRAPSASERNGGRQRAAAEGRDERGRPQRERRDGGRETRDGRDRGRRDSGPRMMEAPPPPDPLSVELGQKFRDAQAAVRDARKALDKRHAEFGDKPEWMVAQLAEAEQRFEEASTAWVEHLSGTGRKMARR